MEEKKVELKNGGYILYGYFPDGTIEIEEHFNKHCVRHREGDKPAYVEYYENGQIAHEEYFENGKCTIPSHGFSTRGFKRNGIIDSWSILTPEGNLKENGDRPSAVAYDDGLTLTEATYIKDGKEIDECYW